MCAVQVNRWSQAAAHVLGPQQEVVGWVHSSYGRIINVRTPARRLLTLQGEGRLQAPLALALATDVEALGTHLPVGALVLQDIPTARSSLAALRLCCANASVWDGSLPAHPGWARDSSGAQSNCSDVLALPLCPQVRSSATPASSRTWSDWPLCYLCRNPRGAGAVVGECGSRLPSRHCLPWYTVSLVWEKA